MLLTCHLYVKLRSPAPYSHGALGEDAAAQAAAARRVESGPALTAPARAETRKLSHKLSGSKCFPSF